MDEVCDYEKQRLARIQENQRFLASLGLDKKLGIPVVEPKKKKKVLPNEDEDFVPRRSTRDRSTPREKLNRSGSNGDSNGNADDGWVEGEFNSEDEEYDEETNQRIDGAIKKYKVSGSRNSNPGRRIQGGRVYDSENGSTCHQCRQKTMDPKVKCTNELVNANGERYMCTLMLDEVCLVNRYGQTIEAALASGEWKCPKCIGICNCSFCRRKKGLAPTGILIQTARAAGFDSVDSYLRHRSSGSSSTSTDNAAPAPSSGTGRGKPRKRKQPEATTEDSGAESDSANDTSETTKRVLPRRSRGKKINYSEKDEDDLEDEEIEGEDTEGTAVDIKIERDEQKEGDSKGKEDVRIKKEQENNDDSRANTTTTTTTTTTTGEEEMDADEFEVEKIVDVITQKVGRKTITLYHIKWKGYDEYTWEPKENLFCEDILAAFEAQRKQIGTPQEKLKDAKGAKKSKSPTEKPKGGNNEIKKEDDENEKPKPNAEEKQYEVQVVIEPSPTRAKQISKQETTAIKKEPTDQTEAKGAKKRTSNANKETNEQEEAKGTKNQKRKADEEAKDNKAKKQKTKAKGDTTEKKAKKQKGDTDTKEKEAGGAEKQKRNADDEETGQTEANETKKEGVSETKDKQEKGAKKQKKDGGQQASLDTFFKSKKPKESEPKEQTKTKQKSLTNYFAVKK